MTELKERSFQLTEGFVPDPSFMPQTVEVVFVSGNQGKIKEAVAILSSPWFKIVPKEIDLPEFQGDINFICMAKCKAAAAIVDGPVIVDDTSLSLGALHGLPGPYIKWFHKKLGSDGLVKLISEFGDKSATAICTIGFTEGPGKEVILCHGATKGYIVEPKGDQGFGWDACFLPEESEGCKTFAEMSFEKKNEISHRVRALNKLKLHFKSIEQYGI